MHAVVTMATFQWLEIKAAKQVRAATKRVVKTVTSTRREHESEDNVLEVEDRGSTTVVSSSSQFSTSRDRAKPQLNTRGRTTPATSTPLSQQSCPGILLAPLYFVFIAPIMLVLFVFDVRQQNSNNRLGLVCGAISVSLLLLFGGMMIFRTAVAFLTLLLLYCLVSAYLKGSPHGQHDDTTAVSASRSTFSRVACY